MIIQREQHHLARARCAVTPTAQRYRAFTRRSLEEIPQIRRLRRAHRMAMKAVSAVLPFRVNEYVVDQLIDWSEIPNDPIYQLTFPQPRMLSPDDFHSMLSLVEADAPAGEIAATARRIQKGLNPHPAGQRELNVPTAGTETLRGMQHKYRETVLFFPSAGQTCHAYCTYCFRWAQFAGIDELKFAARETEPLIDYLGMHPEVSSVLLTGGDPLIMRTHVLRRYIEPLLTSSLEHVRSIRIGTKAPAYWPYRFVTDPDADELLRLFEEVRASGRHLALMAHYSHPRELETPIAQQALARIQSTGAVVRCQAPLIRRVNDNAGVWATMWRQQIRLGAVPYYMFVERDTGPKRYFEVPLARALTIFNNAYRRVSGLARTVRGPSMSATPGKILVDGTTTVAGRELFVLKFIQARDPNLVGRVFFAKYDTTASWLDDLRPAFGEPAFFFEPPPRAMAATRGYEPSRLAPTALTPSLPM